MKRTRPSLTLLLALLGLGVTTTSFAATANAGIGQLISYKNVSVNLLGVSPFENITITLNGTAEQVTTGLLDIDVSYGSGRNTTTITDVPVFCTDLYQSISISTQNNPNTYSYYASPASEGSFPQNSNSNSKTVDTPKLLALEYLYGAAFGSAANYYNTVTSWSADQVAGFQLAIWEIVTDNTKVNGYYQFSLTSGNFQVTDTSATAAENYASTWLSTVKTEVYGTLNTSKQVTVETLVSASNQDLLLPFYTANTPPIPEPSTYALAGASLLGGMVGFRRLRASRKSSK